MIVKKGPNGGSWAMVTLVGYGYARGNNHSRRPRPQSIFKPVSFPGGGIAQSGEQHHDERVATKPELAPRILGIGTPRSTRC